MLKRNTPMGLPSMRNGFCVIGTTTAVLLAISASIAYAQGDTPQKDPSTGDVKSAGTAVVNGEHRLGPTEKLALASKGVEFTEVGEAIASPSLKLPDGAEKVRQMSAQLPATKDNILLNWYKVGGQLCVDVLTSQDNQAWVKRNHVIIKGAVPIRPEKMAITLRYLMPAKREGFLIIVSDESGDLTLMMPTGFGGTVSQQLFLVESKAGTRHSYNFSDLDGRGYAIVRESVDSTGQVKPADDTQYYVWNGRTFIPRRAE